MDDETLARINARLAEHMAYVTADREGSASQALWDCEDGWIVGYTTERITGGPHDGKFATLAYKPDKSKTTWERVYLRAFSKRKLAKERAITMFAQHSPRWAKRHGR